MSRLHETPGAVPARGPRLLLVGPVPPPHSGHSVAFGALAEASAELSLEYRLVDINDRTNNALGRAAHLTAALLGYLWRLLSSRWTVYLTIAQSRRGFARDLAFIWPAWILRNRLVLHLHGGNFDGFYAGEPRIVQWLIRATLRRSHAILVLGDGLAGMFDFDPALAGRVHVVANGNALSEDVVAQRYRQRGLLASAPTASSGGAVKTHFALTTRRR